MVSDEADGMLSEILSCSELRSYCKKTGMVLEGGITVVFQTCRRMGGRHSCSRAALAV